MFKKIVVMVAVIGSLSLMYASNNQNEQRKNVRAAYHIIASVQAKEGQADNLRSALQKIQQLSCLESTCLQYEVIEHHEKIGQFGLYEQWTSKEDHALQFDKPYIKEFIEQLPTLGDVSLYIPGHNLQK